MDSTKAEDFEFTIDLATPDNGEQYVIELSNATLTNIEGYQAADADISITISRSDLE
jgi:alkyl sulfatase BDS1-like metallo-beta-lactamase superfamily hydrolase